MALAYDDATNATALDAIIVTSTKVPRTLADVPVVTQVITKEELAKTHANKLEDALKYVPGLQIRELHGKTGSSIWMQGLDGDRVLVLIDGNPVIPTNGSSVDIAQIAVGDIERVEIIKGAYASLYGTSAMGGVVNVITTKPQHMWETSVTASSGNWQQQSQDDNPFAKNTLRITTAIKQHKWQAQAVVDLLDSEGFTVDNANKATQGWRGYKNNFSGKVGYTFANQITATNTLRRYREDVATVQEVFVPGLGYGYPLYQDVTHRDQFGVVVEQSLDNHDWKLRTSHEDYRSESSKANDRTTEATNTATAAEASSAVGDEHLLAYGVQHGHDFLDAKNHSSGQHEVRNEHKRTFEVYLQDSYFVTDQLEVMPGARYDRNDRDGQHIAPSINSLYRINDVYGGTANIRLGLSNGYRTPNLKELYYIFDHSQLGYMVLGNDSLKPEQSTNVQTSIEWSYQDGGFASVIEASVYRNEIDNSVDAFKALTAASTLTAFEGVSSSDCAGDDYHTDTIEAHIEQEDWLDADYSSGAPVFSAKTDASNGWILKTTAGNYARFRVSKVDVNRSTQQRKITFAYEKWQK